MLDKEEVAADLPAALEVVRSALSEVDLLIEDFAPGVLARLGLDPGELRIEFPSLVILSLSHHGQDGPYRDLAGSALTSYALGGSLYRAGRAIDAPLPPPAEFAESITGITGALAAVAVLAVRGSGGAGDLIDCSVVESCLSASDWGVTFQVLGMPASRVGAGPGYPVYAVADGFVRVLNLSPRQWVAFRAWLGNPPEISGPEWEALPYRAANADVVDMAFAAFARERGREELFHEGQQRGVSIVPVYAPEEIATDSHFQERGTLAHVAFPGLGGLSVPRAFVRFGMGTMPAVPAPPVSTGSISGRTGASLPGPVDFSRLKVVELGAGGVGPEASRFLSLFGADVIKVEHLSAADFMRTMAGPGRHEMAPTWASSNRNKRSVELNLKVPGDLETMLRLMDRADVFIENNGGGVCDRLGIGYETVSTRNPRIVYCSSQMAGAWGPASPYTGFGPSNHALSGLAQLWTHPDNPKPEGNTLVHPDHMAGKMLALAASAALINRERTGHGCFVDLAQSEFAMATIAEQFVEASLRGRTERRGQDHPAFVPHGVFPAAAPDTWIAIAVETDIQWQALKQALGNPDWAADAALDHTTGRLAARVAVRDGLAGWTRTLSSVAAAKALQKAGVPAMPVCTNLEQLADPHLNARGAFDLLDHPFLGWGRYEGAPFRFERFRLKAPERAPLLGEHTADVIKDWLG
jgi:crotonobetainyl-CoA:carnitine CoA-transferase CaiB-like acyl-CoA transferase